MLNIYNTSSYILTYSSKIFVDTMQYQPLHYMCVDVYKFSNFY